MTLHVQPLRIVQLGCLAAGAILLSGATAASASAGIATTGAPSASSTTSDPGPGPVSSSTGVTPPVGASLTVTPGQGYPGQHVLVTESCPDALDPASSPVLILGDSRAAAGTRYTDATISPHAAPGWYPVTAVCDNTTRLSAGILVLAPATPPGSRPGATDPAPRQVTRIPHGAPQTGDGSTAGAGGSEE